MKSILSALLLATAVVGCGDNALAPDVTQEASGAIQVAVPHSPADIAAIHISVTGPDFVGSIDTEMEKQSDGSWVGAALDIPPVPIALSPRKRSMWTTTIRTKASRPTSLSSPHS